MFVIYVCVCVRSAGEHAPGERAHARGGGRGDQPAVRGGRLPAARRALDARRRAAAPRRPRLRHRSVPHIFTFTLLNE